MTNPTKEFTNVHAGQVKRRILRGSVSQLFIRVYSLLLQLVLNGVVARAMSQEQFAQWLVATNLILIVSLVAMGGMNQAIVNVVAGRAESLTNAGVLIKRCWAIATRFAIGTSLCTGGILAWIGTEWLEVSREMIFATITCAVLVAIHRLSAATLRSLHHVGVANLIDGPNAGPIPNTILFIVVLASPYNNWLAVDYLWAFAAALALMVPMSWVLIHFAISRSSLEDSHSTNAALVSTDQSFFSYTLPFLIVQVLTYFSTQFDVLLARYACDAADTALYGAGRRLGLQIAIPWQIISASAMSSIAQLYARGDMQMLERTMRYSTTLSCVLTLPLLLVCAIFPQLVLTMMYGESYAGAGSVLIIICIGQAVNCFTGQCALLLMMKGLQLQVIAIKVLSVSLLTIGGLYMASHFGILGLAAVSAAVLSVENIYMCILAKRKVGIWTLPLLG